MRDRFRRRWLRICRDILELIDDSITPRLERIIRRRVSYDVFREVGRKLHMLADEIAEEYLRETVDNAVVIDHEHEKILGAEPEAEAILLINAFDGSQNGVRGIPFYGGSIAVARYNPEATLKDLEVSVVRNFATDDVYTAVLGEGAFLNQARIHPSVETDLKHAIVGLDTSVPNLTSLLGRLNCILNLVTDIRRMGCSSLEVCEVARGAVDAFIDIRGTTDIVHLASKLIIEEAGGVITDDSGRILRTKLKPRERVKFVASGNKILHRSILSLLRGEAPTPEKQVALHRHPSPPK